MNVQASEDQASDQVLDRRLKTRSSVERPQQSRLEDSEEPSAEED